MSLLDEIPDLEELLEVATDAEAQLIIEALDDEYFPGGRRPSQDVPPGDWSTWLIQSGRGWGKTRTGAEWLAERALGQPGTRWAIVARTFTDARDTCVEGESGLLSVLRRRRPGVNWDRLWNRSLGELTLPNGSRIKCFTSEKPDGLRGPQHHGAWCDELAAWYNQVDTWDQVQFGLRLGDDPRAVVTTTPRALKLVKELAEDEGTVVTKGSTYENRHNLAELALAKLEKKYAGTRLGRQELDGELLTDVPGALWTLQMIENGRVPKGQEPTLRRVVVAIDPAVTSGEDSDDTGIVAVGLGMDGDLYVLADRTCHETPERWARRAVDLYDELEGDRIVAEVNNGGDLVTTVLRTVDASVPVRVVHASRGKRMRAEPIAALYEQGRVHHVGGFSDLEEQMTAWTPDDATSPDRLDALVWACTELAVEQNKSRRRSIVSVG